MRYPQSDIQTITDQIDVRWFQERTGFVTGSSGWFGGWICQVLESIGAKHYVLRHKDGQSIDNFHIPEQKIDYIIHLSPGPVYKVVECAQKHDADVLFTSSGAVYAEDIDEYGDMKRYNEWELINGEINVKIARCFTMAGAGVPMSDQYALGSFISQGLCNKDLHIWGDGSVIRTYLYMTDLITWLFKILIDGDIGKPYDVGSEEEITMWELARMVRNYFPDSEIVIENRDIKERFPYYVPDLTDTYDLGCRVTVDTEEAIKRTVDYYKVKYDM
jgi:nucleoside-diphosphate-sugar epimerase